MGYGEVMLAQRGKEGRSQRGKEDVLTDCPQVFDAAVKNHIDLLKLVRLLLVAEKGSTMYA